MKAHIPATAVLSKTSRRACREYVDGYEQDSMRRLIKLACVALHNGKSKFGTQRLAQFILDFTRLAEESKTDQIFWLHTDTLLIDKLGIQFDREKFDLGLDENEK